MTVSHRVAALLLGCFVSSAVLAQSDAPAPAAPVAAEPAPPPADAAPAAPMAPEAPTATEAPMAPTTVAAMPAAFGPVSCVEVERLRVVNDGTVAGQTERAASIPDLSVDIILERTIANLQQKLHGIQVVSAEGGQCPDAARAAVLRSDLVDFRKGNMALRYLVGFGAGTQKVRVNASLMRKPDASVIAQQQVSDAKWGGAFGGTNRKGLDDFASKVAQFAAKSLNSAQ
jgi:hypothetical protein